MKESSESEGRVELYHGPEHPEELKKIAEKLFKTLNLGSEEQQVALMAIEYHDVVIEEDYDRNDKNPLLMIKRKRGTREGDKPMGAEGNEALSAKKLREAMEQSGVFTEEQIKNAVWAIEATYPAVDLGPDFKGASFKEYPYFEAAVGQNKELGQLFQDSEKKGIAKGPLFFQPHLEKPLEDGQEVPKEVLVVALSDLGGCGTKEAEEFANEGNKELRELLVNLRDSKNLAEINKTERKELAEKFIDWAKSQAGFVAFQALRFEKIVHLLKKKQITDDQEQQLRGQFSHYIDNIQAAVQRAEKLKKDYDNDLSLVGEKPAFKNLALKMGYKLTQGN